MSIFLGAIKSNDYINFTSRQSVTIKLGKNIIKVQYKEGEAGGKDGYGMSVFYAMVKKINNKDIPYDVGAYLSVDIDGNPIYDLTYKKVENYILDSLQRDSLYIIIENKNGKYIGKKIPKNIEVIFS